MGVAVNRWRVGEHREAAEDLREAIKLEAVDRTLLAFLLEALAWCHSSGDEHERAARLLGSAHAAWRPSGARVGETIRTGRSTNDAPTEPERHSARPRSMRPSSKGPTSSSTRPSGTHSVKQARTRHLDPPRPMHRVGLTKRDQEIAELVARGLTNKAIATQLVIGKRTVVTYVENILVKLGFNSRNQSPHVEINSQPRGVSRLPMPG